MLTSGNFKHYKSDDALRSSVSLTQIDLDKRVSNFLAWLDYWRWSLNSFGWFFIIILTFTFFILIITRGDNLSAFLSVSSWDNLSIGGKSKFFDKVCYSLVSEEVIMPLPRVNFIKETTRLEWLYNHHSLEVRNIGLGVSG